MALNEKTLQDTYQIVQPPELVHMDPDSLDRTVNGHGCLFEHYRAVPCPLGQHDPFDIRESHDGHEECSDGFIYEKAGDVFCVFRGNSNKLQFVDAGLLTGATVEVTVPRFYADKPTEEVMLAQWDRFFLKEKVATVIHFQRFEANASGSERLSFPVESVEMIVGSDGRRFGPDDYVIERGLVKWVSPNRPTFDPKTGRGQVCSIRYRYIPFWYVERLIHEIRVIQTTGGMRRAPYSALLQREYIFENQEQDSKTATDNVRAAPAPRRGAFGPR